MTSGAHAPPTWRSSPGVARRTPPGTTRARRHWRTRTRRQPSRASPTLPRRSIPTCGSALYNLGLLALRQAEEDSAGRDGHLADAERAYREALLLRPHDRAAKWNLELAVRQHGGSSQNKAPPSGGGGSGPSGGGARSSGGVQGGLNPAQAEQLLRSIGHEELKTRRDRAGLMRHPAEPGVKDW